MAWDTERTRRALLDAATEEFSEFGFSGARIDRISKRAEINRERLYSYFGNKEQLFQAVLSRALTTGLEKVAVTGSGPEAIGDFAGRYFDSAVKDPALARLVMWEGLAGSATVDAAARSSRAQEKIWELKLAHPALSQHGASRILLTIVALSNTWILSPNLREIVLTDRVARVDDDGATEWRQWLVGSVISLASARVAGVSD